MTPVPAHPVSEPLPEAECLDRLAHADLARIVLSVRCLPAALPARMSLVDKDHVLLASAEEAVWSAAERHDVVSVQIDGLDDAGTWSVMASGLASLADDETPSPAQERAIAGGAHLVRVPLSLVIGTRSH